jgi:hypothetical protein
MATKPVRSVPLAVDDGVGVIVMSANGSIVRIDPQGVVTPLSDQTKLPPVPTAGAATESLLIATDASGNRYQVNPGAKFVSKYNSEGVLKLDNIGKGKLVAPTALGVDTKGNLYLIDEHRVKKIAASEGKHNPAGVPITR